MMILIRHKMSKSQGRVYLCCCKDIYIEMEEVFQIKVIDGAETFILKHFQAYWPLPKDYEPNVFNNFAQYEGGIRNNIL